MKLSLFKLKNFVLFILFASQTVGFAQDKNADHIDVLYCEYHPSKQLADKFQTKESLSDYINDFQTQYNVTLSGIYAYQLNSDSYAYFFSLEELNQDQRLNFISGRLQHMDKYQINSSISRLLNAPIKLSKFIDGIAMNDNIDYIMWDDIP